MGATPKPPMRQKVLLADTTPSPLGQVTFAAHIQDGRGVLPAFPYRIYGSYALTYITQGEGAYQDANGYAQDVRSGDAIFVFPDLPHTYGPGAGRRWSELYLVFQGPVFDTWRSLGLLDPHRPVRRLLPLESWAARLEEAAVVPSSATPAVKAHQVCSLLTLLTDIASDGAEVSTRQGDGCWASQACHLLAQELETGLTAADLVRRAGLAYETFLRRFTATLGLTPVQYRAQRRMEVACHLLQYTPMTNSQIAERLAFSDEYYFSRRFKQTYLETPSQFRRRSCQWDTQTEYARPISKSEPE